MGTFFHVQRAGVPRFYFGRKYDFGTNANFFSRDLFSSELSVPIRGVARLTIDTLLSDYFDSAGFTYFKEIAVPGCSRDERGLLSMSARVVAHQAKVVRELVFEQVRAETFPAKPSRLRGIWLIPHDEEILARWCGTAPAGQFRAYEVEASGNFHYGASKYLKPRTVSVDEVREDAERYWSETVDIANEPCEILMTGEVTPIREITMAGSKQTMWSRAKRLFG